MPQIFSLQNDPLNNNSFFPACILTYTPHNSNFDKLYKLVFQYFITKNEIIQGNNLPKNEKIQGNNSTKIEKIQGNNFP